MAKSQLCDFIDYIACQAPLSSTVAWSLLRFMLIESLRDLIKNVIKEVQVNICAGV